ncbi:MAG: flagellar motor switch protein FliN [Rickettsiales bacterium]|jgi:flagellar motor switch protein FliN/FliY|nr:flagellar motor switch protein FliN [Rickettsiales bacterium]
MADTNTQPAANFTEATAAENLSLETVYDIPVQITVVLGRTSMQVNQLLKLGRGAVIELDKKVGEPIDIFVNNRLVARGEVVVVEERIGITMTEIIKAEKA